MQLLHNPAPLKNQPGSCTSSQALVLTDEQRAAVAAIKAAIARREHFTLQGLAGTGKTTVAAHIAALYPDSFLCAPTAKATSVLTAKTKVPATTVHGAFYHFVRDLEVYATFLTPGHEYDSLDLPPGGWMTAFAFGYALTVHQAQGSEFDDVLLIDEWPGEDRSRWLYTGLTRAKERITIARKGDSS